jgi:hypothetical protein
MATLLCDALTAQGTPCKNSSVGEHEGRNYCRVGRHRRQIISVAPTPEPEVVLAVEADSEPEEATSDESSVSPVEVEVEAEVATYPESCTPCPSCGVSAASATAIVGLQTAFGCLACGHSWVSE